MDPQHVMPGAPSAEETILQTYLQVPFLSPSESHLLSRLSQELIQHVLGYTPPLHRMQQQEGSRHKGSIQIWVQK